MRSAAMEARVQDVLERLGPALKVLRTSSARLQKEISDATGISRSLVSRYETGHEVPGLVSLVRYLYAVDANFAHFEWALYSEEEELACAIQLAAAIQDVLKTPPGNDGGLDVALKLATAVRGFVPSSESKRKSA